MDRRAFLTLLAAAGFAGPAPAQESATPDAYADRFWAALSARKRAIDAAFIEQWFSKAAAGRLLAQLRVKKPEYTDRLVWALSKSLFDDTLDSTLKARTIRDDRDKAEVALEAPEATPSTFKLWLASENGGWRVDLRRKAPRPLSRRPSRRRRRRTARIVRCSASRRRFASCARPGSPKRC